VRFQNALPARSFIALLTLTLAACAPRSTTAAPSATTRPTPTSAPAASATPQREAEATVPARPSSLRQADVANMVELGKAYNISTFLATLASNEAVAVLIEAWPVTFLAPDDQAFLKLPAATRLELLDHPDLRLELALRHCLSGSYRADGLTDAGAIPTLSGGVLTFTPGAAGIEVAGASIVVADLETSLGIIHVIDRVLPGE